MRLHVLPYKPKEEEESIYLFNLPENLAWPQLQHSGPKWMRDAIKLPNSDDTHTETAAGTKCNNMAINHSKLLPFVVFQSIL